MFIYFYGLFNDAVSSLDYVASNKRNYEKFERKSSLPNLRYSTPGRTEEECKKPQSEYLPNTKQQQH
jgi:hypothetical protein